jgi:hypothetical protein
MTDLNEDSLVNALRNIERMTIRGERRAAMTAKLVVTDVGIATTKHRYETEPEFRAAVQEVARDNPDYRRLCEEVGIDLEGGQ